MEDELNVHKMILQKRKICSTFVLHRLTDEQKQQRLIYAKTSSKYSKTIPISFKFQDTENI